MTVDVLCHRVYHDIRAVVQRILDIRAHEGVVHNYHDSVLMRNRRDLPYVHQGQCRVRWRLDPDKLRVWANEFGNVDFDAWAECDLDIVCERYLCEVTVRSSVDIRDGYDM